MTDTVKHLRNLAGVVILAGGASRRMGTPKARLMLPSGESLLDYHVRHALALSADHVSMPVMIADNGRGFTVDPNTRANHPQASVVHIADYVAYGSNRQDDGQQTETGGALVAILSALQTLNLCKSKANATASWLLVISCDSLIPATDLWQKLQSSITELSQRQSSKSSSFDKKVICLADEQHLYPLLGLYQISIEPDLKAYIDSGARRVMPFITPIVQPISLIKNWQYLTNFNTPEEFKRAYTALTDL